ncbi:SLC13 family permease [Aureispira anguillae]|uniref:SLC13 family permease n=1 Tax=Aureispira anguillae TaxID=2864201 RepID=A0A915YBS2_9BACT|nr:SLC13 family permease [Aureispira anguillae]BDS10170.1 SLC13 family permease [Aureispira anguillae]
MNKQKIGLLLGPSLYFLILLGMDLEGLSPRGQAVLATTFWMAIWWVTEAVPIAVTALLPLVLFPLAGAMTIKETGGLYGHPIIFLFVGGFMIASAVERWNLHQRIALGIIAKIGSAPKSIILGFMVATGFLSMWISNTATTIMMVPIGIAIVKQLETKHLAKADHTFAKALLLGIAYAASIGGIATLIGTPTNVIFTGVVTEKYGVEISFAAWMLFAMPIAVVLLFICWYYLVNIGFDLSPFEEEDSATSLNKIKNYQRDLGGMSYEEKVVIAVFGGVALAWMTRSFLLNPFFPHLTDTIIAIIGAISLFIIPTKNSVPNREVVDTSLDDLDDSPATILDWETAVKIPWGVILLFGGGLSLANGFDKTGLAAWIGTQISLLGVLPLFLLLLLLIAAVNFLTEITSNVATVSMILPILASLSMTIGVHPYVLMIGATCAASCAFMLPIATAPNAIVFGSSYIQIGDMIKAGIWLNLLSILLFSLYVYVVMPLVFGIDLYGSL